MMQKKRTFSIVVDCLKMGGKLGGVKHCFIWKNSKVFFSYFEQCMLHS